MKNKNVIDLITKFMAKILFCYKIKKLLELYEKLYKVKNHLNLKNNIKYFIIN